MGWENNLFSFTSFSSNPFLNSICIYFFILQRDSNHFFHANVLYSDLSSCIPPCKLPQRNRTIVIIVYTLVLHLTHQLVLTLELLAQIGVQLLSIHSFGIMKPNSSSFSTESCSFKSAFDSITVASTKTGPSIWTSRSPSPSNSISYTLYPSFPLPTLNTLEISSCLRALSLSWA